MREKGSRIWGMYSTHERRYEDIGDILMRDKSYNDIENILIRDKLRKVMEDVLMRVRW